MTTLSHEVARAKIAESHREADLLREGRRITAQRRRARRALMAGERNVDAYR